MTVIIVQSEYSCHDCENGIENIETWVSENDVDINDVQKRWNQCKSKTKLHEFMIASNFRLVGFEEMIK